MLEIFVKMRLLFLFGVFALPPPYQRRLDLEEKSEEVLEIVESREYDPEGHLCNDGGQVADYVIEPDLQGL